MAVPDHSLASAGNGVEAGLSELASGSGWTIAGGETAKGCKLVVHSRVAYEDGDPPAIKVYPRTILVDPCGVALAVSAEGTPDTVVTFAGYTVLGAAQVANNQLQFREDTIYAVKQTVGSFSAVSSGACP